MANGHYRALFICTGNSARSILAEALMNRLGRPRGFVAYSAGSRPKGQVHPQALALLQDHGFDTTTCRSKSWDEFAGSQVNGLDFVFTVCDQAAGESCPVWPGQPMTAHWGMPDPAAVQGSPEQVQRAFLDAFVTLRRRIELLLSLPIESLDHLALQREIRNIGIST